MLIYGSFPDRNLMFVEQHSHSLGRRLDIFFCSYRTFADKDSIASEQVAEEKQVHLLPLMTKSIAYCEAIGDEACHRLNRSPDDNTRMSFSNISLMAT